MRKIILISLFLVFHIGGIAQDNNKLAQFKTRLLNAKLSEFAVSLNLTPQQTEEFKPIYTEYNKDMMAIWGMPKFEKPTTNEEAVATVKRILKKQEESQRLRSKYIDKFAKVLNPEQIYHLYRVEDMIQRKLSNRKSHSQRNLQPGIKNHPQPETSTKK